MSEMPLTTPVDLADLVEAVFLAIYDDPQFQKYLTATLDADSVEGSMFADDCMATMMLHKATPEDSPVKDLLLATIRVLLIAVMRRYGISRRERALSDDDLPRLANLVRRDVPDELDRLDGLNMESASARRARPLPPWVPTELPPPKPPPVPELGWCARCHRVNPRPGYPEDQDGHDWVEGLDECAYVGGDLPRLHRARRAP